MPWPGHADRNGDVEEQEQQMATKSLAAGAHRAEWKHNKGGLCRIMKQFPGPEFGNSVFLPQVTKKIYRVICLTTCWDFL